MKRVIKVDLLDRVGFEEAISVCYDLGYSFEVTRTNSYWIIEVL